MGLTAMFRSAAQSVAAALNSATQTQTSPAAPSTNANGQPSQAQADEALRQMMNKRAQPSVFEAQVKQISPEVVARRNVFNQPVTVALTKPAAQMTKVDYDTAFARAMLKRAGLPEASDLEVSKFMYEYARVTGGHFGFLGGEQELRALQGKHHEMRATTSEYGLAVADAGMRQIHADRAEMRARAELLRRESQAYGEEALAGFYKLQANGVVDVVNDATKIVGLPELPQFEVTGEYWADKKQVGEAATSIGAALVTGGASLPGDLLLIGSATGNLTEAVTGEDLRTGEQLSTTARAMRGAGGAAGAYAARGTVDDLTNAVTSQAKNLKPPTSTAEAVTTEGVRLPVQVTDEAVTATNLEARAVKDVGGRRNIEAHEIAGGHTVEKHVGKSEHWLRKRLESDTDVRGSKFASSFRNEEIANRVQGRFVKRYAAEIEAWLESGKTRLQVKIDMDEPVGIVVKRGKSGHAETTKAILVLVRDNSPQGWHFLTSYPIAK